MALRSLLFNVAFYLNLTAFLVLGFWLLLMPRSWSMSALKLWGRTSVWLLKVISGTHMEVRGRENIPHGARLLAGKHQSSWDIFALLPLFDDPALVLKRELTYIPLFGWFCTKFRMIAVDREAGTSAMRKMIGDSKTAIAENRQVLIFPEGTRKAPDAEPDYKPGVAALYTRLDVACTPFALNSGLFWPRRRFMRYPGTIIVEFLPEIPAGLSRNEFSMKLQKDVENATRRLVAEGRRELGWK